MEDGWMDGQKGKARCSRIAATLERATLLSTADDIVYQPRPCRAGARIAVPATAKRRLPTHDPMPGALTPKQHLESFV